MAFICACLLASVHALTQDTIAQQRQAFAQKQIAALAPFKDAVITQTDDGFDIARKGQPFGSIRKQITNRGYNGRIALWVAVARDGSIIRVRTLDHQETPGLGDAIDERRSSWIHQFDGRTLTDSWRLMKHGGDIDGITGATITSVAVINAVRQALENSLDSTNNE